MNYDCIRCRQEPEFVTLARVDFSMYSSYFKKIILYGFFLIFSFQANAINLCADLLRDHSRSTKVKTTDVVVKFDHSDVYRQNTGLDLLREAVSLLNRRKPKILEIGPGQGEIMESAILKSNLAEEMITFLEPNTESSKQLHNKFPKSEIIHSPLEGFLNRLMKNSNFRV